MLPTGPKASSFARFLGKHRILGAPCPHHRIPGPAFSLHRPSVKLSTATNTARHQGIAQPPLIKSSRVPRRLIQARHCSYRHNMCRGHLDVSSATGTPEREILPTNVKPLHYDLTLEPDFEKFKFRGSVKIDLEVTEESSSIVLNTLELDIQSAAVSLDGSSASLDDPRQSFDSAKQRTTFSFDKHLTAGSKATMSIDFTGTLNDKLAGFYRSSYKHPDGTTHYLATTQMEPTDARRSFPCFDEPSLKATFTVTLVSDKDHVCLSNMDQVSEKEVQSAITGGARKAVTFRKTPLMSTYLLAFIIGELNYIETNDFRKPIRVYSPPSSDIEHGRFSLELAARTLKFYEKTFDSEYPLPKMDMVAIPDFSAGAMENWGLVTFRSVDLLFDEATSGANTKQRVAEVVQHELAHQWFGNLVTMDFWDGLWLNEGFATWMSWYSCNSFFPDWKVWENYVVDTLAQALSLDSLRSSHPIEVPVKRADEINEIFDAISYSKGSSALRMLSKYLGEDIFMEGVRRYLKKHAYGNTKTEDLWAALADASGKPVEKVMNIWTKNVGYPVVTVTEDESNKSIHLKQNRFLKTGDVKPEEDKTLYPIFLGLRTKDGVDADLTLNTREESYEIPDLGFFKLNADQAGLYRTAYSRDRLGKLGQASKDGLLTVEDRAGMLADAGALASSGYQKTSGTLALVKGFHEEPEYVVWDQLLTNVASVRSAWKFQPDPVRDALKAFQRKLVTPKAHAMGWSFAPDEPHIQAQFKSLLFGSAGLAGDEKVASAAQEMFAGFAAGDRKAIHPNLRGSVYAIALSNGGAAELDVLVNEVRTARDADERNTALRALGRVRQPELMKRVLDFALSPDVKTQDVYMPLLAMRGRAAGVEALWHWFTENWDLLVARFPPSLTMLGTLVKICTSEFATREQLGAVQDFFAGKDRVGYKMALEQSLDSIRARIGWLDRDTDDVKAFLESEGLLK